MKANKRGSRGFTLIAALMLMVLLSVLSIGLMMMVNTESKVSSGDLQNTMAYRAAEGGIEKMSSDLSTLFTSVQSPQTSQICALSSQQPIMSGITWTDYSVEPQSGCATATPSSNWGQIQTGPNAGLWAQIIPVNLLATAEQFGGPEVSMTRTAQVALIPVFQFGVFSDGDLGFYSSPDLDFAGRVHTNGDLYLGVSNTSTLTFHDKLEAYGNVVRKVLPNGLTASANNDSGTVLIPTADQGCDGTQPNCRAIGSSEGSVVGAGGNPPASSQNGSWPNISVSTYSSMVIDGNYGNSGGTGAKNLSMPFVNGNAPSYEIIRRPPTGESTSSGVGLSRLYNEAQIRVLLSDDPSELSALGAADPDNVRLANYKDTVNGDDYSNGVQTSVASTWTGKPVLTGSQAFTTYFATASTAVPDSSQWTNALTSMSGSQMDWASAPVPAPAGDATLVTPSAGDPTAPILYPLNVFSGSLSTTGTQGGIAPGAVTLSQCSSAKPPVCPTASAYPYYSPTYDANASNGYTTPSSSSTSAWNLIDGYLRVEYKDAAGTWHPVTREWLSLGFARGLTPPTTAGSNPVNPNAILLLQEPADRNGDGTIDQTGAAPYYTSRTSRGVTTYTKYPGKPPEVMVDGTTNSPWYGEVTLPLGATPENQSYSMYNWYPINFYDAREGEIRDTIQSGSSAPSCAVNGVMNAVEIDVGNLSRWLKGSIGVSGTNVDYAAQNGYILYFSDRRGMLPDPNVAGDHPANTKSGDSGLEDSINSGSSAGTPDGNLDTIPANTKYSPEDVNENNVLDNFGAANLGLGFGYKTTAYSSNDSINYHIRTDGSAPNPYSPRIAQCSLAAKNWVSGARHVLRLVDGTLGNVPVRADNSSGGFTVASENPVYILGNYNSNSSDPIWASSTNPGNAHSAAAVIADAVTVLSNNWLDSNSMFQTPTNPASYRNASNTYYRLAIAAGKNMNFPFPAWATSTNYGFGTDGGVHNFLRFLEDWSGANLYYEGSLVSLYYSTYATGTFKCCTYSVYEPPSRHYAFDPLFAVPSGLPPGTPLFRDVNNLSYRQYVNKRTY